MTYFLIIFSLLAASSILGFYIGIYSTIEMLHNMTFLNKQYISLLQKTLTQKRLIKSVVKCLQK